MLSSLKVLITCLAVCATLAAQPYNVTFEKKTGYNGWTTGWDTVHIARNDIVTLAIVPKLGGRVMQYDLGTNKHLYIDSPASVPTSGDDVVGGFRVLPSPQSDFVWPSPPSLDFKPYTCTTLSGSADSVVIYLESRIEDATDAKYQKHKGLQFKRVITLYKASSRVKVEMTMLNKGTQTLKHGIWDITQTTCPEASDCWVYFPRNPSSTLGAGKGYVQYVDQSPDAEAAGEAAKQFKPDAAEGKIMGVQYLGNVGKMGADCKAGWICFNDRTTGYAYAKTFTYRENKTYPDSNVSVQVYINGDLSFVEVEVLGPLVDLAPDDSTKLVENWYAARSLGPVLEVKAAGLVTKKLTVLRSADSVTLTGTFGVFYSGKAKTQFFDASGAIVATADSVNVVPNDSLRIDRKLGVPAGAASLRVALFDAAGTLIGALDSAAVPPSSGAGPRMSASGGFAATPSVSRIGGTLTVSVPSAGSASTEVFAVNGRRIASFIGKAPYRHVFDVSSCASNALVVRVAGNGMVAQKILPSAR